jgi:hypothetical protein
MKTSLACFSLMRTSLQAINSYTSENYALPQLNNSNHILQLDGALIHFAHTVCNCLKGKGPIAWLPCSPDLKPMAFFLWNYLKDQV